MLTVTVGVRHSHSQSYMIKNINSYSRLNLNADFIY